MGGCADREIRNQHRSHLVPRPRRHRDCFELLLKVARQVQRPECLRPRLRAHPVAASLPEEGFGPLRLHLGPDFEAVCVMLGDPTKYSSVPSIAVSFWSDTPYHSPSKQCSQEFYNKLADARVFHNSLLFVKTAVDPSRPTFSAQPTAAPRTYACTKYSLTADVGSPIEIEPKMA